MPRRGSSGATTAPTRRTSRTRSSQHWTTVASSCAVPSAPGAATPATTVTRSSARTGATCRRVGPATRTSLPNASTRGSHALGDTLSGRPLTASLTSHCLQMNGDALPDDGEGRVFSGAEHGADVDVVLIEVEPGQGARVAPLTAAQVWVVQEGEATFFLGALQARVIRTGEIVRIPAGVAWRYRNTGENVLRAIA